MNWHLLRRNQFRETLSENKIDAYLTFDFSDIFYLTGFPSEGCFVLASRAGDFIFAPMMLGDHARTLLSEDPQLNVVSERLLLKSLENVFKKNGIKTVGFDASKITVSLHRELSQSRFIKWVPLSGLVLKQRMIKDEEEIDRISKACRITTTSQQLCFDRLREGQNETEVAFILENLFHQFGSPKVAFETIIAFEENASFPHHVCGEKKLAKNSTVLMDLGCVIGGYRSDLTRTAFFGKISPKFCKVYNIVKKAQAEGMAAVREGVTAGKVDFICREAIRKSGYGDYFIHGTGHGVGIDIHEPPRLGIKSKEILKEGMVVTVEPGIYLPGEFGVRIEDTVLVKKKGCEILTTVDPALMNGSKPKGKK